MRGCPRGDHDVSDPTPDPGCDDDSPPGPGDHGEVPRDHGADVPGDPGAAAGLHPGPGHRGASDHGVQLPGGARHPGPRLPRGQDAGLPPRAPDIIKGEELRHV